MRYEVDYRGFRGPENEWPYQARRERPTWSYDLPYRRSDFHAGAGQWSMRGDYLGGNPRGRGRMLPSMRTVGRYDAELSQRRWR